MIKLTNVTKQYSNVFALKNVTLKIYEPGIYCLLGRNGTEKTTILILWSILKLMRKSNLTISLEMKIMISSLRCLGIKERPRQ